MVNVEVTELNLHSRRFYASTLYFTVLEIEESQLLSSRKEKAGGGMKAR